MPRNAVDRLNRCRPRPSRPAAIASMSVTFGSAWRSSARDRPAHPPHQPAERTSVDPQVEPVLTFGHDTFELDQLRSPARPPIIAVHRDELSSSSPAMLAITAVPTVRR